MGRLNESDPNPSALSNKSPEFPKPGVGSERVTKSGRQEQRNTLPRP